MNNEKRSEYFTRDSIMGLLSDAEIARVTTAESGASLTEGDEYVDLEELDQGVRTAKGTTASVPMGRLVSRKAVQEQTWNNIVEQLKSRRIAPVHSGAQKGRATGAP
jgi:hypothetical protein